VGKWYCAGFGASSYSRRRCMSLFGLHAALGIVAFWGGFFRQGELVVAWGYSFLYALGVLQS
jgi:hypothetical protein